MRRRGRQARGCRGTAARDPGINSQGGEAGECKRHEKDQPLVDRDPQQRHVSEDLLHPGRARAGEEAEEAQRGEAEPRVRRPRASP